MWPKQVLKSLSDLFKGLKCFNWSHFDLKFQVPSSFGKKRADFKCLNIEPPIVDI